MYSIPYTRSLCKNRIQLSLKDLQDFLQCDNDSETIADNTNSMNGNSANIADNTNDITHNSALIEFNTNHIDAISDNIAKLNAGIPQ